VRAAHRQPVAERDGDPLRDRRRRPRSGRDAYVNRPGPRLLEGADRFAWAFDDATLPENLAPMPSGIARIE